MAPARIDTPPPPPPSPPSAEGPPKFDWKNPDKTIFPDGLKTSGQFPPLLDQMVPYEEFPPEITGPTVWKAEDYAAHPERWTHRFSGAEIDEIGAAADAFIAADTPLTGITVDQFPLPSMRHYLGAMHHEILNGKGFILFKGLPVQAWGLRKSAVAYMGLGTYLGYFVSQNGLGHVLGHVKDVGANPTQLDSVRIYRTTARQFFHTDDADIVGLLCIARAFHGGESDLVSAHHVWNHLQRHHPDVARTLCQPIWYWDRKGEISAGQDPYHRQSVFYREPVPNGRVYCQWDPYHVQSLQRFWSTGVIPPLSAAQQKALRVLEETCAQLALHMVLEIGDIQFLSNCHVFHARTAYQDYPPPAPRRHLMRLWLATPDTEGGWTLPFADSSHKKRGGTQVNDTPPKAPVDAE